MGKVMLGMMVVSSLLCSEDQPRGSWSGWVQARLDHGLGGCWPDRWWSGWTLVQQMLAPVDDSLGGPWSRWTPAQWMPTLMDPGPEKPQPWRLPAWTNRGPDDHQPGWILALLAQQTIPV